MNDNIEIEGNISDTLSLCIVLTWDKNNESTEIFLNIRN